MAVGRSDKMPTARSCIPDLIIVWYTRADPLDADGKANSPAPQLLPNSP